MKPLLRGLFLKAHPAVLLLATAFLFVALVPVLPDIASAHGLAGKRFFPSTISIEDPFVSDELSLVFGHIKEPAEGDEPPAKATEVELEYSKRITPDLGISIGDSFVHLNPDEGRSEQGFGNLEIGIKYQFLKDDEHETILSLGLVAEIGGTGTRSVGTESFSVISPMLFFGKGLGDLAEGAKFLRPLAVTGVVGFNVPTRSTSIITTVNEGTGEAEQEIEHNPITLTWGFSLQYSLQYLQSFVQDVGLPAPFNRMIAIVEFPMETCLGRDCRGETRGFVNPGILWFGKSMQLGLEAQIPVNKRSGSNVGILGILHLFIDDLFPEGIGRPIFP